jgi:hypothetical protein
MIPLSHLARFYIISHLDKQHSAHLALAELWMYL